VRLRFVCTIVLALVASAAFAEPIAAQRPGAAAAVDSAMVPLAWLVGEWEGTGTMQTRTGADVASVHEKVEGRLGGRVLIMEGIGRVASASQ
jgi:hypothetical protein